MVEKKYLKIGIVAFGFYLLIYYWSGISGLIKLLFSAATPLILGLCIAYVVNILMGLYEKIYFPKSKKKVVLKTKRPVCIVLSFATVVAIICGVMLIVLPELLSSIELLFAEVPQTLNDAYKWIISNEDIRPFLSSEVLNASIDWQSAVKDILDAIVAGAGGFMNSAISIATSIFSFSAQLLIGFIFSLYLLGNKEKVLSQINKLFEVYVNKKIKEKVYYVAVVANSTFKSFIVGQCTEAVILGALCALGMSIFKFPYAGMTGAVIGITALIPVAGAYIGAVVGAFMICTVNPLQALFFIIYLVILQQLEGNIIYPRVVGTSIGLPGMWVLAAVTIGGTLMGIAGMLFGVPLAATLYKLLRADVNKKLDKEEKKVNTIDDVSKIHTENVEEITNKSEKKRGN